MNGLPGYDAWKTRSPDEYSTDDINGSTLLSVWRLRLEDDGVLVDTEVSVDVRVRRGEVNEATEDENGEPIELTPEEEAEAVALVEMDPQVEEE